MQIIHKWMFVVNNNQVYQTSGMRGQIIHIVS